MMRTEKRVSRGGRRGQVGSCCPNRRRERPIRRRLICLPCLPVGGHDDDGCCWHLGPQPTPIFFALHSSIQRLAFCHPRWFARCTTRVTHTETVMNIKRSPCI